METIDYKLEAARKALTYIREGHTVGLGAGSTIAHLVRELAAAPGLRENISVVTASFNTRLLLQEHGFIIRETASVAQLDFHFDGCDQFDRQLNALKSGGGVHTLEKLLAAMAQRFILVGDGPKYVEKLLPTVPVVIELVPDALSFVQQALRRLYPDAQPQLRLSNKKDGAVITERGNLLIDIFFTAFPPVAEINPQLKAIPGILETSLFYRMAHEAIIAGKNGVTVVSPER
ncbi:ribose 5-phosphate isomerase A [Chitinophaga oryzae]|uniref:Ribose 5-phosphate isomerase A n=1 Tax=Chitinophaga oryzae TaxID=2725414 RepID=A0AAE6ZJZ6_9BACT|nr:ribose 5-phosphate isomerase A [Chitinophaga oryzae]QJB33129.1 ribose 5-phosphate isomerase A [Chitinophaga oryzae]QJB39604.1 ribose 5-phosphate isomerase A [Chitinophaga oryzae]